MGCLIAFLWYVYTFFSYMVAIYGQAGDNMRKIGMYYNIWGGRYALPDNGESAKNPGIIQWFLWLILIVVTGTLLSWATVVWLTIVTLIQLQKNSGMPEDFKKYRWRIRNVALTRIQMLTMQMEMEGTFKEEKRQEMWEHWNECSLGEFNEEVDDDGYPNDPITRDYMTICNIEPAELVAIRKGLTEVEEFGDKLKEALPRAEEI